MAEEVFDKLLGEDLRHRLSIISWRVAQFWEEGPHHHFTFHGPRHSRQVQKKLVELIQEWDKDNPLSEDEIYILFASALLYDIGMQCTDLRPELDFDWQHKQLSPVQLQQIRKKKHQLTYRMIFQSVNHSQPGHRLQLGLLEADDYTRCIAEVCRGCSDDPLETTTDIVAVGNGPIRVPLLIALLRLADQLYIDSDRVNLDLLEHTPMPPADKLRWWLYHYTQTLPINKGQIPFRYKLPSAGYKGFLGHIRTIIEQPFHYATSPVIQALWGYLQLVPHKKAIVENPSPHFSLREMNPDLMQELSNVEVEKEYEDDLPQKQTRENRCLLVLDYENFLIQLGLEGYFPTLDELNIILPDLLIEAREQYPGHLIDGIAAGHWDRPNLRSTVAILQDMYTLLSLEEQEQSTNILSKQLNSWHEKAALPHQVLLVAPPRSLVVTARQLQEEGQAIGAWITDTQDARIFPARIHHTQLLSPKLHLSTRRPFSQEELKTTTELCVLCLQDKTSENNNEFSFEAVNSILSQIEGIKRKSEWWRLYLIQQGILTVKCREGRHVLKLSTDNSTVNTTLQKRAAVINAFPPLAPPSGGKVRQNTLMQILQQQEVFQDDADHVLQFLKVLRERNLIFVDTHTSEEDESPLWQLNSANQTVMAFNSDGYLPFFLLGLDHSLVQYGHQSLYEDTLNRHLKNYMDNSMMIQEAYQLALSRGWVKKREKYQQTRVQSVIEPAYELYEVQQIILNCSLILKMLYSRKRDKPLQRNELWSIMSRISSFTLEPEEFNRWLDVFQRNQIVRIEREAENLSHDTISLCSDTPLVQHLLGRLNTCWVVLAMRTLRAKSADTAQPYDLVVQRVASFATHNDHILARWSIEYAKLVKLILPAPSFQQNSNQSTLYLNQHSIVRRLDAREREASPALVALVQSLSRPQQDDRWVPRYLVVQRMGNNPIFGSTHEEFNYWINSALHRKPPLLKEKPDPVRASQMLLPATS